MTKNLPQCGLNHLVLTGSRSGSGSGATNVQSVNALLATQAFCQVESALTHVLSAMLQSKSYK